MPVYNSGIYLNTAVESILNQSFEDFELILVDDGSTDGSSEKCDEYALKDSRVVVIHQENRGICNARNAALEIAQGEYVAFSDHDDEYHTDLLKDNIRFAETARLDIVKFCKHTVVLHNGNMIKEEWNHIEKKVWLENEIKEHIYELVDNRVLSCVWDCLFRKDFLNRHEIKFDPFFKKGGEDIDFMSKCILNTTSFGTNDKCYYTHYIRHGISTSTLKNDNIVKVILKTTRCYTTLFDHFSPPSLSKVCYTYFITKFCLCPIFKYLSQCPLTKKEKMNLIEKVQNQDFFYSFIKTTYLNPFVHGVYFYIHLLYNLKMYKGIFFLYKRLKRN